jgi:hypothetical protein
MALILMAIGLAVVLFIAVLLYRWMWLFFEFSSKALYDMQSLIKLVTAKSDAYLPDCGRFKPGDFVVDESEEEKKIMVVVRGQGARAQCKHSAGRVNYSWHYLKCLQPYDPAKHGDLFTGSTAVTKEYVDSLFKASHTPEPLVKSALA